MILGPTVILEFPLSCIRSLGRIKPDVGDRELLTKEEEEEGLLRVWAGIGVSALSGDSLAR